MDAFHEGKIGLKRVQTPPDLAFQPLMLFVARALSPICTLTRLANTYVSRQGKGIYRRHECAKNTVVVANTEIIISHLV